MAGGVGNSPWGYGWGSSDESEGGGPGGPGGGPEHIPSSALWTQFDLTGVRQPDDIDRTLDFVEASGYGTAGQFFINSFNMASGGVYPTTPAILDIAVPVTETFTVEYRLQANQLPDDFDDPVFRHLLLSVNNAAGACATLLLSQGGLAYTGAISFDAGLSNQVSFDHILDPGGVTVSEQSLLLLPGSDEWFGEGEDVYIRVAVDWENQLTYLFVTAVSDITPGVDGADSTGHVLRALLPVLPSSTAVSPPIDRVAVSVRGTAFDESNVELFHYNLSARLLIPDLPPRALTGPDQASRLCSVVQLNGASSFDPEGNDLEYDWRLVDAPDTSQFVFVGADGTTVPLAVPTGYTDVFTSAELGTAHVLEPVVAGDVLLVGGISYTIESTKPSAEPGTFYVVLERPQVPDDLVSAQYKLLRQTGVSGSTTVKPTFYPDVAGFYLFDLRVFDGLQWSTPNGLQRTTTVVNVLESPLPRGCTPDVSFVFDYLSDFWRLVEDSEKFSVFWSALAQTAATELFTLWQHEYSKSIRDIQRQFVRRWLHYDTVLGEPLPELTKVFPVWSGVTSAPFTTLSVNNQRLGLVSPLFPVGGVINFSGIDPVDPRAFAKGLARQLKQLHESFDVDVIELASGELQLRIDADFEFAITEHTTVLFVPGDTSGTLEGLGETVAERTFKVDRSLQGLNLIEAFLVIGANTYVIDRVIDVAGDDYPFQRVVVRRALEDVVSGYRISGWVSSELLNFYNGLVTDRDHVDFEVLSYVGDQASTNEMALLVTTVAYGASPLFPSRLPVDFGPLGQYIIDDTVTVRLARVVRRGYVPVDSLVQDVPVLQEHVVVGDDEATLRRNLDFFLEEFRGRNALRFVSGQSGPDVFEGARPPHRLWAEYTYLDNGPVIEANFGELVEFTQEDAESLSTNLDYLSAVSGLMYAYTNGPTVRNLRIGTQILLGLPYAEEDGTIEEIRNDLLSDQGRILIRDTEHPEVVRAYTYPKVLSLEVNPNTGAEYAVGDTVARFDPLVEGAEVLDYVKDPTWFQGIVNQGVFLEVQKFHTFAVRVDVRAFNLSALLLVQRFILKIKPTYTLPKFIVQLRASGDDGDEISVNDTVTASGTLTLEDGICSGRGGASITFDQPWPGGGQPWAGDPAGHNASWRNRFDNNDDDILAVYPTAEQVNWAYDKEHLCPSDDVTALYCETFGAPTLPQFDSVFAFDTGTSESFEGQDLGPFAVPAGATGLTLTLTDSLVSVDGTLTQLRLALMGVAAPGTETALEAVVNVNGAPDESVVAFDASGTNVELILSLSHAVTAGDTVEVRVRAASQAAFAPGWDRILVRLSNSIPWQYDVLLPAGTYCGLRTLVE